MLCEEAMQHWVMSVHQDESVEVAARLMRDEDVEFVAVCDDDGRVVGTVTDRDLVVRLVADGLPPTMAIGDVMTRDVASCTPADDLSRAEHLMQTKHQARIVCVDEESRPIGEIGIVDVSRHEIGVRVARLVRAVARSG